MDGDDPARNWCAANDWADSVRGGDKTFFLLIFGVVTAESDSASLVCYQLTAFASYLWKSEFPIDSSAIHKSAHLALRIDADGTLQDSTLATSDENTSTLGSEIIVCNIIVAWIPSELFGNPAKKW